MSLVTVGNLIYRDAFGGEAVETESSSPSIDGYGLDEMTRSFSMRPDLVAEFLRRYPVGTPDTQFPFSPGMAPRNPGMSVVGAPSISKGRAWTTVGLKLIGKMGEVPAEPLVKIVDGTHEDTVQVYATVGGDSQPLVTLDYRAFSTTYEYYTQARPAGPRYLNGAIQAGDIHIIRKRGIAKFNGEDFGTVNTFCQVEQRMGEFTRTQEGLWWHCVEPWEWALVQTRTFFSPDLRTVAIV